MTFTQWYYKHKDEIQPEDVMAWCAEAWMAGFDAAMCRKEELDAASKAACRAIINAGENK